MGFEHFINDSRKVLWPFVAMPERKDLFIITGPALPSWSKFIDTVGCNTLNLDQDQRLDKKGWIIVLDGNFE